MQTTLITAWDSKGQIFEILTDDADALFQALSLHLLFQPETQSVPRAGKGGMGLYSTV